jgi:hypothetical protein
MTDEQAGLVLAKKGTPYKTIAEILKVSPQTVTNWSNKYKWKDKIEDENLFRETSQEQVQTLISHNLRVLNLIARKQAEALDESASIDDLQKSLTNKGDVDALQKLFTTIKGKELEWDKIIKVVREFTEYCEHQNASFITEMAGYASSYLNDKRREL